MLGNISRVLLKKGMATRMPTLVTKTPTAVVRRSMATEPMELPKMSGAIWMVGGVGFFLAVGAWVNFNDLIVWGLAPERPKSV